MIPVTDISDVQFGFRENRGTNFACTFLNDIASYCKQRNTPFVVALDAEKCFDSICHISLFFKLINVLLASHWLVLYNWYSKLSAVVRWKRVCSNSFQVTRGTKQGSILSAYLFNIFIDQLLLYLNNSDAGVIIGNQRYNCMAYADDVTLFSTNVLSIQYMIAICTKYSERW